MAWKAPGRYVVQSSLTDDEKVKLTSHHGGTSEGATAITVSDETRTGMDAQNKNNMNNANQTGIDYMDEEESIGFIPQPHDDNHTFMSETHANIRAMSQGISTESLSSSSSSYRYGTRCTTIVENLFENESLELLKSDQHNNNDTTEGIPDEETLHNLVNSYENQNSPHLKNDQDEQTPTPTKAKSKIFKVSSRRRRLNSLSDSEVEMLNGDSTVHEDNDNSGLHGFPLESISVPKNVERMQVVMVTIDLTFDPDELQDLLEELLELITHDECVGALEGLCEEKAFMLSMLQSFKKLISNSIIQQYGCELFSRLMEISETMREQLQTPECANYLLRLMDEHAEDPEVQAQAIRAIGQQAMLAPIRQLLLESDKDVIGSVIVALSSFQTHPEVQASACFALRQLIKDDPVRQADLMHGEYRLILDALNKNHDSPNVVKEACELLRVLMEQGRQRVFVRDHNALTGLLVSCLKQYTSEEVGVFCACLGVLEKLSVHESVQHELAEQNMSNCILNALMHQDGDEMLQAYGLRIFENIACWVLGTQHDNNETQWLKQIYFNMSKHFGSAQVQQAACNALCKLLEYKPNLMNLIGEESENNQDPIHTLCLGAILMHGRNAEVFKAACNAIYWIAADNTRIRSKLTDRNAYIAILFSMKLHKDNAQAQELACKAIRGLCIFCEENKKLMMHYGVLSYLMWSLSNYPKDGRVQVEAIAAIACLADVDVLRNECVMKRFHKKVILAMRNHRFNEDLQEVSLEALATVAAAAGGIMFLNEVDALPHIIEAMRKHHGSYVIQKKGLVMIQLLAEGAMTDNQFFQDELADVIIGAMTRFPNAVGIQAEGCVAMQVLAEKEENISVSLVNKDAHECLFYILENYEGNHGLHDLASECLFVLSCVREQKSRMLLAACNKGMLQGVECLVELGADVNVGHGNKTPLCCAVQRGDEMMVKVLLKQGVSDLHNALGQSLEQETYIITGMLLKYIGHDKQAGSAAFSGLGLGRIYPEFLYPTLTGKTFNEAISVQGKHLASKVKSVREKRFQRMTAKSVSDESHLPKLQFRYSFEASHNQYDDTNNGGQVHDSAEYKNRKRSKVQINLERFLLTIKSFGKRTKKPKRGTIHQTDKAVLALFRADGNTRDEKHPSSPRKSATLPVQRNGSIKTNENANQPMQSTKASPPKALHTNINRRPTMPNLRRPPVENSNIKAEHLEGMTRPRAFSSSALDPSDSMTISYYANVAEAEEWKKCCVSGANIPVHPLDPRLSPVPKPRKIMLDSLGEWGSKPGRNQQFMNKMPTPDKRASLPATPTQKRPVIPIRRAFTDRSLSSPAFDPDIRSRPYSFGSDDIFELSVESSLESSSQSIKSGAVGQFKPLTPELSTHSRRRASTQIKASASSGVGGVVHVDLSNNFITSLEDLVSAGPGLLVYLEAVEKLDLSQNHLREVPDELFKFLPQLVELYLHHNFLEIFPAQVLACKKLKVFDISSNSISDISMPPEATSFSIQNFNISQNELRSLPEWISYNMPGLEHLLIAGNKIQNLPSKPLLLKRLHTLDLSNNYLKEIPDHFLCDCTALQKLLLACNELELLPSGHVADKLSRLTIVKMDHNLLAEKESPYIPKFILNLPRLESLNLSHNNITNLPPPHEWKTKNLRELFVNHNMIEKLDMSGDPSLWGSLERLDLSNTLLQELPKEVGQLISLTSLDVSHTNLTSLPDEMGRLNRLWELKLEGLELDLPQAVQNGRTKDLIIYLCEKLKNAVEHYRMKMMVVGYGNRGKSTLIRTLIKEIQPSLDVATVGILVKEWKLKSGRRRPQYYTLRTWDFAGQEEFYSTHQCFLSNRSLYLVVYNVKAGPSEIDTLRPWLLNIQARAPSCPVIFVGTHKDQLPKGEKEEIINKMRRGITELCNKLGFPEKRFMVECDCRADNSGIDQLKEKVKEAIEGFYIRGQPVMGQKIPESFLKLENLILAEARCPGKDIPIIKQTRLNKIVKDANLDLDPEELKQAVRFLHESGVMLHFEDVSLKLEDYYFLDPQWLCRMMAQIVTLREINPFISDQGILRRRDMSHLFTGKPVGDVIKYTFPTSLIPQYIKLLQKFEIFLPMNIEDEEQYLIPCRLPQKEPKPIDFGGLNYEVHDRDGNPITDGHIQRQYEMPYVPLGFWSRLISRLIVFIPEMVKEDDTIPQIPQETIYWIEGICVYWTMNVYYLIKPFKRNNNEVINITLSNNRTGARILGHIVDHIDALIDEWYPGLTQKDPTGNELVRRIIPCVGCPDDDAHMFEYDDLVNQSELDDCVDCPRCGRIPLDQLAPDISFADLEPEFQIRSQDFVFEKSPEFLLGDGGYGSVYRAKYREQNVAVKVYNRVGDIHPHKTMRQEVTILRRLNHPSLVSMLAVGLDPRVVILELAPMGSLKTVLQGGRVISRPEQHRIALQVAEGLMYLHECHIIYRDMKPDNVLIFNLALGTYVNAKISDYGISRFAASYGLKSSEGTPGYRASEVILGEEAYTEQADMYSFGMTLYELVTGGRHPFDDLPFRNQLDEAVRQRRPVDPITVKGVEPWPDMQDLIYHCLQHVPEARPKSADLYKSLQSCEVLSLKDSFPVSQDMTVECVAARYHGDNQNIEVEMWIGSGNKNSAQLSWLNLSDPSPRVEGKMLQDSRILCMATVHWGPVLVGCMSGHIWVFDPFTHKEKHQVKKLDDAVLCLHHQSGHGQDRIYAGLANGCLAVFETNAILQDPNTEPVLIAVGHVENPVKCIVPYGNKLLYIGCGRNIVVYRTESAYDASLGWDTQENNTQGAGSCITNIAVSRRLLYLSKLSSSVIEVWDHSKRSLKYKLRLEELVRNWADTTSFSPTHFDLRVTALTFQSHNNTLWIGTGGGLIIMLDSLTRKTITVIKRHVTAVRSLVQVERGGTGQPVVVSGGLGFKSHPTVRQSDKDKGYGYVAVWDGGMPQHAKQLQDYLKRRHPERYDSDSLDWANQRDYRSDSETLILN